MMCPPHLLQLVSLFAAASADMTRPGSECTASSNAQLVRSQHAMTHLTLLAHFAGFFKGLGKGMVGAIAQPISGGLDFASSAFEGIDASKDQLIGRPRAGTTNRRLRLPRAIGEDGKVTAFLGSDGTEKEVSALCWQGLARCSCLHGLMLALPQSASQR